MLSFSLSLSLSLSLCVCIYIYIYIKLFSIWSTQDINPFLVGLALSLVTYNTTPMSRVLYANVHQ
jgi:hypothetical protein